MKTSTASTRSAEYIAAIIDRICQLNHPDAKLNNPLSPLACWLMKLNKSLPTDRQASKFHILPAARHDAPHHIIIPKGIVFP